MIHQAVQSIVSTFAKLDPFLADGSQRRGSICADREIIKPDDADLVRNFVSELLTLDHRGIGDQIIAADNSGDPHDLKDGEDAFPYIE